MNTGMEISAFARELNRQHESKRDLIANTSGVSMVDITRLQSDAEERGVPRNEVKLRLPLDGTEARVLSQSTDGMMRIGEIAHQQLAAKTGVPKRYYDTMLDAAPDLLATNVNHWLHANPENRMFRALDGRVRAVLSDRYQRIDNLDIAHMVMPILEATPGLRVVSCDVTERKMYLKAVTDRVAGEVKVGDVVNAGVVISNSEVGHGALSISPLVFRLVCLNGMVVGDKLWRKSHVGSRLDIGEELAGFLSDETRAADDKALMLKVRDLTAAALDASAFEGTVERMREASGDKIKGDPIRAVEVLANKLSFTSDEGSMIMRNLIEGHDLSRWGMLNAVTRTAQDIASYDRATDFEIAGGKVLDLSRSEWREIAEAA